MVLYFYVNAGISQNLDEYKFTGSLHPDENAITSEFQFNGYTNYWHDIYREWIRFGNLFKIASPDVALTIAQSKVDIAGDMIVPGLSVQEGFLNGLLSSEYTILDQPAAKIG